MQQFFFLIGLLSFFGCVDRINIDIPDSYSSQLVVDGLITDAPGPYEVKLSLSSRVNGFLKFRKLVSANHVSIHDNLGNSEELSEIEQGTYRTKPNGIRGVVGREYFVRVEMRDSRIYESIPDKMNPVGEVDSLYYTLESFQPLDAPTQYGFRVYLDANGVSASNLYRWKFTGTYVINTDPKLHTSSPSPSCTPDPRPCSGFRLNNNVLQRVEVCSCCVCWVNEYEDKPFVSDNQFISNGRFRKIEVAYVPVKYWPFQLKYRFEVKQMSLSKMAFDYWKTIQSQKEGGSSLFQPPIGKIRTNLYEIEGRGEAQGIFYASAIALKQTYLTNQAVKTLFLKVPNSNDCYSDRTLITESCVLAFKHSSAQPPLDWN